MFLFNTQMKKIQTILAILLVCAMPAMAQKKYVHVNGGTFHVQGIAYDKFTGNMYMSFTSAFFKTDMDGNVIASVGDINGHLGAMTFDEKSRRVFASLELKDDSIGKSISDKMGVQSWSREQAGFYIAVIDVDRLTQMNMKQDDVMSVVKVAEACSDYKASVSIDGKNLDHRYGCSGIDGVTIGPAFGSKDGADRYLYVAYGIYGDVSRTDNDYNILLTYPLEDVLKCAAKKPSARVLPKPHAKYFVHTGNTTWGVQNLAYDKASDQLFMAVYAGKKPQWNNYRLFALKMDQKPFKANLDGVPYHKGKALQVQVCGNWHFKWGSTGLCPLGDGRFYISQNGKKNGNQYCDAVMYRWTGSSNPDVAPFKKMK